MTFAARYLCRVLCLTIALAGAAFAQDPEETGGNGLLEAAAARSPAVAAVLDMPHETPLERMTAVFTLLDLGEVDVASVLLEPVLKAKLDDESKAALVTQLGTARFLNLARRDKPAAEGEAEPLAGAREFARSCIKAASDLARDPQRIAALVTQLNDSDPAVSYAARVDLAVTGAAGAQACFEALAATTDEQARANLLGALAGMRPEMDPLLLAVLAEGSGLTQRDAAELAGHVGMLDTAPLLAAIAVSDAADAATRQAAQGSLQKLGLSRTDEAEARTLLVGEIRRLESLGAVANLDDDSQWWTFADGRLQSHDVAAEGRQTLAVARLAKALGGLPQATPQDQQLALLYAQETARLLGAPLPAEFEQLAQSISIEELSATLASALQRNQVAAVLACVESLGKRGDSAALISMDARPAPLAQALKHPDRRVRFAALEAVMRIAPQRSFPGSSAVAPLLWRFAAGGGPPQAVVACSTVSRASDWAGQLRGLGYDATPATTGREALQAAVLAPRLALVLVDSEVSRPNLREVLYQLRGNTATVGVPAAVLSSGPHWETVEHLAENDPLLLAAVRPHDAAEFKAIVEQLAELEASLGSAADRNRQAAQALEWIAALLAAGHPYDELLREAGFATQTLYSPDLFEPSLKLLAELGLASSQQTLLDFASDSAVPLESRQKAARAFAANVEHHGKLVTPSQVAAQFDRYNASETADRDTQQVLGYLLDVLESKPTQPLAP